MDRERIEFKIEENFRVPSFGHHVMLKIYMLEDKTYSNAYAGMVTRGI